MHFITSFCTVCLSSSVVEQWTENPCVSGSIPLSDILIDPFILMNLKLIKFLNILKNASLARKSCVLIKSNPFLLRCAEALYKEGFILSYSLSQSDAKDPLLCIKLRIVNDSILTSKIKFISKPSCIRHLPYHQICRFALKNKVLFFFTNKGILTLEECKQFRTGGTLSFSI